MSSAFFDNAILDAALMFVATFGADHLDPAVDAHADFAENVSSASLAR